MLCAIVLASFALQLAIHQTPALQEIFKTEPISLAQCLAWMGLGAVPLVTLEARKIILRLRKPS